MQVGTNAALSTVAGASMGCTRFAGRPSPWLAVKLQHKCRTNVDVDNEQHTRRQMRVNLYTSRQGEAIYEHSRLAACLDSARHQWPYRQAFAVTPILHVTIGIA